MKFIGIIASLSGLALAASPAFAGQVPLYNPAPDWIDKAPIDLTKGAGDGPELLVFDTQLRMSHGELWSYTDRAVRVTSPEALGQLATIILPWAPDHGDLIIHEAAILRDGQTIDLVAGGKGLTILRREEALEARDLTGILSATMPVEGLRVGDVLRLRYSVTSKDAALAGNTEVALPLFAAPLRMGFGRMRLEWESRLPARWLASGQNLISKPFRAGDYAGVEIALPVAKQLDRPEDAPSRFQVPPWIEASTFADWASVSRIMAPLYSTNGLITSGTPLGAVLEEVKAAPTDMARVQMALRRVQDDVRYLAVLMDSGNYVPQKPTETWAKRYGDCKAKTLLLLALLRGAGIEAEPVLANAVFGDMVPDRVPGALAFNHILVRATVGGQVLWLDGTSSGDRSEDLMDTPRFWHVLPLRSNGSGLIDLPMRPLQRPLMAISVDADEGESVDLPSPLTVKMVLRGPLAANFFSIAARMDETQRTEQLETILSTTLATGQWINPKLETDSIAGTATISARGVIGPTWHWQEKRMVRPLDKVLENFRFAPNRLRSDWKGIPVAVPGPISAQFHLTLHLPDGGKGITVDGAPDTLAHFAGQVMTRHMTIDNGILTFDERVDSLGGEIADSAIPDERDRLDTARAALPILRAPADTVRSWMILPTDGMKPGQLKTTNDILDVAIRKRTADDATPLTTRASLRKGTNDFAGAAIDFGVAATVEPDVETYLNLADMLYRSGQVQAALANAQKARSVDPASAPANLTVANLLAETGDQAGALALLDRRISLGGNERDTYRIRKASVLGEFGDPAVALAQLDAMIVETPGNHAMLNARCWIKGTRNVLLESALKDCNDAIAGSNDGYATIDSRAMVLFRLGRYAEALNDLDTVISQNGSSAPSHFLRAIVEKHMEQKSAASRDLALANRLNPMVARQYARYGITP